MIFFNQKRDNFVYTSICSALQTVLSGTTGVKPAIFNSGWVFLFFVLLPTNLMNSSVAGPLVPTECFSHERSDTRVSTTTVPSIVVGILTFWFFHFEIISALFSLSFPVSVLFSSTISTQSLQFLSPMQSFLSICSSVAEHFRS